MPTGVYPRKPKSEETRRKISAGLTGKKLSLAHRKNLSLSHIGLKPWNKGVSNEITKANAKKAQDALRGKPAWNRGLKMPQISGENHPAFKGDAVGYSALHDWVYRYKGNPEICQGCGSEENLQWASIDGKYIRDLDEWVSLCRKCHAKYDDIINKMWKKRKSYG